GLAARRRQGLEGPAARCRLGSVRAVVPPRPARFRRRRAIAVRTARRSPGTQPGGPAGRPHRSHRPLVSGPHAAAGGTGRLLFRVGTSGGRGHPRDDRGSTGAAAGRLVDACGRPLARAGASDPAEHARGNGGGSAARRRGGACGGSARAALAHRRFAAHAPGRRAAVSRRLEPRRGVRGVALRFADSASRLNIARIAMRVRHKTPTLVSMWMLDVFCCALGCVTLLWLLNTRQAGTALTDLNEVRAQWLATSSELDRARIDLKLALANLDSTKLRLNSEITQLLSQLGATPTEKSQLASKLGIAKSEAKAAQAQLDATKVALNAAETKLDSKATDLATLRDKNESAEDLLRKKQKEVDALTKKAKLSAAAADDMARLIRKKDDTIAELTRQAVDSLKLLDDAATKLAASKKDLDAASAAAKKTDDKTTEDRVAAAGTIKDLTKKISEANATIIDLQGEKAKLA